MTPTFFLPLPHFHFHFHPTASFSMFSSLFRISNLPFKVAHSACLVRRDGKMSQQGEG